MKVLMFGWEFPPHISGGLGTACEGLTCALSKENVELIFVVPKLYGDERAPFSLISASDVSITESYISNKTTRIEKEHTISEATVNSKTESVLLEVIEINSFLSSYIRPVSEDKQYTVEQWNEAKVQIEDVSFQNVNSQVNITENKTYQFTGSYGPNLFAEILRYAVVANEIAANHNYDIIHAHDWITFPAGLTAKKVKNKKLIVHVHATEIDRSGEHPHPVIFAIEKEGLEGADHIIAVSEWTKQVLIKYYNIEAEKISVVHNGVVTKEKNQFTKDKFLGSHVVTFLGRITYQKGPFYFVQAALKVLEIFPDVHFVVAGSGDLFPRMVELVALFKLSDRFHFTGFLKGDDIERLWSLTDLYVMPSVSEPFGITPLEAIQAGVPVIISNQSGVSEVMPHAIKVDFWDVIALANAICNVLAYESLSTSLRENSRNKLLDLTWAKAARKTKSIYQEQFELN
jgi:glycogen(starch) synthase